MGRGIYGWMQQKQQPDDDKFLECKNIISQIEIHLFMENIFPKIFVGKERDRERRNDNEDKLLN